MPLVRAIQGSDLDAIAQLMELRLRGAGVAWRKRLAWQHDANPWKDGGPCGVVLEDSKRIVGYHFGIPQPLWLGDRTALATFALDLYIDERFRGGLHSISLIKAIAPRNVGSLVASSSANDISQEIWKRLRAVPAPGGDMALVKLLRPARLALATAERLVRGAPRASVPQPWQPDASDGAPQAPRSGWRSELLRAPFEAAAELWRQVRPRFPLATDRDGPYLRWRYGADSQGGAVVGLFDAGNVLRCWYAFRLSDRGGAVPLRVFRLLDLVASPDDRQAIAACVADVSARARRRADVVEARGMRAEFRAALSDNGFRERRLPSNPFLLWSPPRSSPLSPSSTWHLVSADGDGGFS
jgi:hypothetical protein